MHLPHRPRRPRPASRLVPAVLGLALAALVCACAPRTAPQDAAQSGPVTVQDILAQRLTRQHTPVRSVFSPPEDIRHPRHAILLSRQHPDVALLRGVTCAIAKEDGVAAGFENGTVTILGAEDCRTAALPGRGPVDRISWQPGYPALAATQAGSRMVHVLAVERCAWVGEHRVRGDIERIAISPRGAWLAVVDAAHKLWLGSSVGVLDHVGTLRFKVLAFAFTPGESVLMAADSAGWVTLWTTSPMAFGGRFLVPGGPFTAARFDGRVLTLTPKDGRPVGFDVATRAPAPPQPDDSPFTLAGGVLTYTVPDKRWVKRVAFSPPPLTAAIAPQAERLRLADMDGETRVYSLRTGRETTAPDDAAWESAAITVTGEILQGKERYRVADPIMQSSGKLLLCRYIAGIGFYLWWVESPSVEGVPEAPPGALPLRTSIRTDTRPGGVPLASPPASEESSTRASDKESAP